MPVRLFALPALLGLLAALALGGCSDDSSPAPTPSPELTSAPSPEATLSPSPQSTPLASPDVNEGTPLPAGCTVSGLTSDLSFDGDRFQFAPGEAISMSLSLTNCSQDPKSLFYPDSQRYEFIVEDEDDNELWRWSQDQIFTQALGEETIEPGETVTYTEAWDQRDQDGESLPPGLYQIFGFSVGCANESTTGCHFGPGLFISITP